MVMIEELTLDNCAVGLLKRGDSQVLVVSTYMDIKLPVVHQWLPRVVEYADDKGYQLLVSTDSNAHLLWTLPQINEMGFYWDCTPHV